MGFFNDFFFGARKGKSKSEKEKMEAIEEAARGPKRGGLGALLGPNTGPAYRKYKHWVQQDVEKFRIQDKYTDTREVEQFARDDAKWELQRDVRYGISDKEKTISRLQDKKRQAGNRGQTDVVKQLDRQLSAEMSKLGDAKRFVDRQRRERDFHREKYLERKKFGRKIRNEEHHEDAREQFHEGVREQRHEIDRQKRIQQLQQMQSGSSAWGNRNLGTGKPYEKFLPQAGGPQPGSRRPPSRSVPPPKTSNVA